MGRGILVPVESPEAMPAAVHKINRYVMKARLDADVVPVVTTGNKKEMYQAYSSDADCIFLNVGMPDADGDFDSWHNEIDATTANLPSTIIVHSTVKSNILV